jgi:HK97 family phage major capsid protein
VANQLVALRQKKADLLKQAESMLAIIDPSAEGGQDRDFTSEEQEQYDAVLAMVDETKAKLTRVEALHDELRTTPTTTSQAAPLTVPDNTNITGGAPVTDKNGNPFASFGDQLACIIEAGRPGGRIDERLLVPEKGAAATGGGANIGSDGGFLIRTQFSDTVYQRAYESGALASRCDRTPIGDGFDSLSVPYIDETSRATGSRWGGVQVYRRNEADTVTAKKPKIGEMETKLEDLMGLAYVTNRLIRDATAMDSIYSKAFSEEFAFKLDDEIYRGSGAGECLGILNSNATITVAKESGQTAKTIVSANIVKMFSRLRAKNRPNAVWFYNQDIEPLLWQLSMEIGTGGVPVYMPPGGLSEAPYGRIMGRPAIAIEHAETLGTAGDIALLDLNEYQLVEKGGLEASSSMHVRFIYDEMAFKWIMRVNGQPKWKTALTPYKGSNTTSPAVVLATRA